MSKNCSEFDEIIVYNDSTEVWKQTNLAAHRQDGKKTRRNEEKQKERSEDDLGEIESV